jgi:hypothetical protein
MNLTMFFAYAWRAPFDRVLEVVSLAALLST